MLPKDREFLHGLLDERDTLRARVAELEAALRAIELAAALRAFEGGGITTWLQCAEIARAALADSNGCERP
jgi:hypothetical protein